MKTVVELGTVDTEVSSFHLGVFLMNLMKWSRSVAITVALTLGIAMIDSQFTPAEAGTLVNPTERIGPVPAGQVLFVGQLFALNPVGVQFTGLVEVSFYLGGGKFSDLPYGTRKKTFQDLNTALAQSFVATISFTMEISARGMALGSPALDLERASVVVIPTALTTLPSTTVAPAPTTAPTAPTAVPGTAVPTTAVPTTAVPTTAVPTTAVPTTAVPAPTSPTAPPVVPPTPTLAPVATPTSPPVALSRSIVVVKNTSGAATLRGTDPEGSPLTYSVADFPENGRLTGRAPNLVYIPDPGFVGTDAFTYTVSDGASTSEITAFSITVISTKTNAISTKTTPRRVVKKKK